MSDLTCGGPNGMCRCDPESNDFCHVYPDVASIQKRLAAAEAKNTELEKELFILSSDIVYCGVGHVTAGLQEKAKRIYGKLRESGGVG